MLSKHQSGTGGSGTATTSKKSHSHGHGHGHGGKQSENQPWSTLLPRHRRHSREGLDSPPVSDANSSSSSSSSTSTQDSSKGTGGRDDRSAEKRRRSHRRRSSVPGSLRLGNLALDGTLVDEKWIKDTVTSVQSESQPKARDLKTNPRPSSVDRHGEEADSRASKSSSHGDRTAYPVQHLVPSRQRGHRSSSKKAKGEARMSNKPEKSSSKTTPRLETKPEAVDAKRQPVARVEQKLDESRPGPNPGQEVTRKALDRVPVEEAGAAPVPARASSKSLPPPPPKTASSDLDAEAIDSVSELASPEPPISPPPPPYRSSPTSPPPPPYRSSLKKRCLSFTDPSSPLDSPFSPSSNDSFEIPGTSPVPHSASSDNLNRTRSLSEPARPNSPTVRFGPATVHRLEVAPGRRLTPIGKRHRTKSGLPYLAPLDPGSPGSGGTKGYHHQPLSPVKIGLAQAIGIGMGLGVVAGPSPKKLKRHLHNQAAMGRYWLRTEEEDARCREEAQRRAKEVAERVSESYRAEPALSPMMETTTAATVGVGLGIEGWDVDTEEGGADLKGLVVAEVKEVDVVVEEKRGARVEAVEMKDGAKTATIAPASERVVKTAKETSGKGTKEKKSFSELKPGGVDKMPKQKRSKEKVDEKIESKKPKESNGAVAERPAADVKKQAKILNEEDVPARDSSKRAKELKDTRGGEVVRSSKEKEAKEVKDVEASRAVKTSPDARDQGLTGSHTPVEAAKPTDRSQGSDPTHSRTKSAPVSRGTELQRPGKAEELIPKAKTATETREVEDAAPVALKVLEGKVEVMTRKPAPATSVPKTAEIVERSERKPAGSTPSVADCKEVKPPTGVKNGEVAERKEGGPSRTVKNGTASGPEKCAMAVKDAEVVEIKERKPAGSVTNGNQEMPATAVKGPKSSQDTLPPRSASNAGELTTRNPRQSQSEIKSKQLDPRSSRESVGQGGARNSVQELVAGDTADAKVVAKKVAVEVPEVKETRLAESKKPIQPNEIPGKQGMSQEKEPAPVKKEVIMVKREEQSDSEGEDY